MDAVDRAMIDRLLGIGPRMKRGYRENPLTGGAWIAGEDSVQEQRRRTKRALDAQCEYARRYPDAPQPLLTNYHEIADVKATGGLGFIQALFAQSIEGSSYDFDKHPTFDDFAAG